MQSNVLDNKTNMVAAFHRPSAWPEQSSILVCAGYGLALGRTTLFSEVDLSVPGRGITVMTCGSEQARSMLLRSLAGRFAGSAVHRCWGEAHYAARPIGEGNQPPLAAPRLDMARRPVLENLLAAAPHLRRGRPAVQQEWAAEWLTEAGAAELATRLTMPLLQLDVMHQRMVAILREVVAAPGLLMLEEPLRTLDPAEAERMTELLTRLARHLPLLITVSDAGHARRLADRTVEFGAPATRRVDDAPPMPSAAPAVAAAIRDADPPSAVLAPGRAGPRGFVWVVPQRLGCMPRPGTVESIDHDLALLKKAGVTTLVTLTEDGLERAALQKHDLDALHFGIARGQTTSIERADELLAHMQALLARGHVLAVHCFAGFGRTGAIMGAFLMREFGLGASDAMRRLWRVDARYVRTAEQERFLFDYEKALRARTPLAQAAVGSI